MKCLLSDFNQFFTLCILLYLKLLLALILVSFSVVLEPNSGKCRNLWAPLFFLAEEDQLFPFSSQKAKAKFKAAHPPPLFVLRLRVSKQLCGLMCMIAMTIKATITDKRLGIWALLGSTVLHTLTRRQRRHGMGWSTGRITYMRWRLRGRAVAVMQTTPLKPLHGASVMRVMRVVRNTSDQVGVAMSMLQRMQRGAGQSRRVSWTQGMGRHANVILSRSGAVERITPSAVGLHDFYHFSFNHTKYSMDPCFGGLGAIVSIFEMRMASL